MNKCKYKYVASSDEGTSSYECKLNKEGVDVDCRCDMNKEVIAIDLDGTLAYWDELLERKNDRMWIGSPIPSVVEYAKKMIKEGHEVVIFTARLCKFMSIINGYPMGVSYEYTEFRNKIRSWTLIHIGVELESTCIKERRFTKIIDDKAICVERNKGFKDE